MAEGIEETDGGGSIILQGFVLLIREFEVPGPTGTPLRPTGYFSIEYCKDTNLKENTLKDLKQQRRNPRDLIVVREYQEANALNTHRAAKEAMKKRQVIGKEGWYFLSPDGDEKWEDVEKQITQAIQDYNDAWGLNNN